MGLFNDVFSKASIYDMLFFNIKSVLIHPSLKDLEANNKALFDRWKDISKSKFENNNNSIDDIFLNKIYCDHAPYYAEYSKIVAITYATIYFENGELKRFFKKIVNDDEYIVILTFFDVLHQLSLDSEQSTPKTYPILTGHDIIKNDIPFLIKRFFLLKNKFENKQIPYILKRSLDVKPWESGIIDILNVWKFNGFDNIQLTLIADYVGLKKTVDLLSTPDLSKYYWNGIQTNHQETLDYIALQSATQTNLCMQLMNELRAM